MRQSDGEDMYADWMLEFLANATTDNGYDEDEELDRELMDELYDEDMDVYDAVHEYLVRR